MRFTSAIQNHRWRDALTRVGALIVCLVWAAPADAAAVWPSTWQAITVGGGDYTDPVGDENPDSVDLIGGDDGSGSYTAGFWNVSVADDQLSLRMRVDADGAGSNNVWQFLFDTDGDTTTIDWVLEVRQSGSPSEKQVIFTQTATTGPDFNDVQLSSTFLWTGALADWSRWGAVTDGSNFDGDTDYFIDAAIPLSTFFNLAPVNGFRLALSTSTSHTQINKDEPLGLEATDPVSGGFGDYADTPEPNTGALTGLGLCILAAYSRATRTRRTARV